MINNKNFTIVIAILVLVGVVSLVPYFSARFETGQKVLMSDFPKKIGEWVAEDIPLSDNDYAILETKNLIMRDYKTPKGDSVLLYIVYSENNRRVVHPPEICYTGGGSTIVEKSVVPISSQIKANKFIIENKDSRQTVIYLFKTGEIYTYNYFKQQLKIVFDHLLNKRTSGALIRLSATEKDNNSAAALELIKKFFSQIEPLLPKYVP